MSDEMIFLSDFKKDQEVRIFIKIIIYITEDLRIIYHFYLSKNKKRKTIILCHKLIQ